MIKGNPIYHFKGKGIYNLPFSQKHSCTENLYARMAQNWAEYGSKMADLGHFALFSQDLLCHTILANQKKMDLVGETDKVHLII